jgi:hypothetical protein
MREMQDFNNDAEDAYVTSLVARAMYLRWCEHKGFNPKPGMYADAGSMDYARVAVDILGYDQNAIDHLLKVTA